MAESNTTRDEKSRDRRLGVRVSEDDMAALNQLKTELHMSTSEVIRTLLHNHGAVQPAPRLDDKDTELIRAFTTALKHVGVNINQIARKANTNPGTLDEKSRKTLELNSRLLDGIYRKLKEMAV